jgi:putative membrane-bound dehydrogenase-like protein
MIRCFSLALVAGLLSTAALPAAEPKPIRILFLGDNGHHKPSDRYRQVQPVLEKRGIDLQYTDKVDALNPKTLADFDGLLIYANTTKITPEQEQALLEYVASGKGFIPLHCASYCFLNSPKYVELVGAQFQKHGTGAFRTTIAEPSHPLMKGFRGFESWDETYVHTKHNDKDRTVLEYRVEGDRKEPWTWVRTHGKGRVFYTAWGHDERTWGNPGFHNLLERGIRWAAAADLAPVTDFDDSVERIPNVSTYQPKMTELSKDVKPFEYVEAKVPYYAPGRGPGQPLRQMQKPLSAVESMKHMVHPDDFELKLFATEDQIGGKPICMNWDERGRLWVAVTLDYPNELQPEGKGRDRILILEDTDGDGKADKVTVFADKLSIPTSLVFANGGVIVHQAPHTLFLKSSKGDDHADIRTVLFSGWGTRDTHAGPSNLHYGLDNWYYGIVGYSGFSGTVGDQRHRFSQGFYRFKPPHPTLSPEERGRGKGEGADGSQLEFLRNTSNNSWGVGFSEEGFLFGSTANGNPSVHLPIPNRYYESVRGWASSVLPMIADSARFHPITDKVRQVDWHGQFTAAAGHALYTARAYPKPYWNRAAFVTDPTGHLAATLVLDQTGTAFHSHYGWNLLASDDEWCAPVMAEVGPDGYVWLIDWYAFIVQHNPTPPGFKTGSGGAYETELRDKKHGRIYRLVPKNAKPQAAFTLRGADPPKLVATLKNDNMFWRTHAQRLLVERGQQDVVPALIELAGDRSVDEIGLNPGVIHALWTLHGLKALDGTSDKVTAAALAALKHKSPGVRRNAVAVLPRGKNAVKAILDSGTLVDPDANVRLAALLALAELPENAEAGSAVARALDSSNLEDRWLTDALTSAAAAHSLPFMTAVAANKGPKPQKALDILGIVANHYARGGPDGSVGEVIPVLVDADPTTAEVILAGLARGWPRNKPAAISDESEKQLARLVVRLPIGARGDLVKLAGAWGTRALEKYGGEIVKSLTDTLADEKAGDEARAAAAHQLIAFRPADKDVIETLLDAVSARTSPELGAAILDAVGDSSSEAVGPAVVKRLGALPPSARGAALRVLLGRPAATRVYLDAVENGQARLADLTLDQKQALAAHPDVAIATRARKLLASSGGSIDPDRQKVIDHLAPLTKRTGDAEAGKLVFRKHCTACHTHTGEGNKIGPDLTGMAVHPKEHLLVEIMDPSRSVEGNYRQYRVETSDGRLLLGLLVSETKTSIELVDAQAKRFVIQRDNIDILKETPKSLMPDGFEKQMTEDDLVNLLEFLARRGKYLPLPLDKVATAISTKGMFNSETSDVERLIFADWSPKSFADVPFVLTDPRGDRVKNAILLHSRNGKLPPAMPRSVTLLCNAPAKAIHLLSGVSGWGYPYSEKGTVSLVVRLHYADGKSEDHELRNGEHFADYIRRVDVPGSTFAFRLRTQQLRYLVVTPKRTDAIREIEFVKGPDATAPVVMAVTVETLP